MLTIRDPQFEPFRQRSLASFLDRMVAMVARDFAPAHAALGAGEVRALVERTVAWGAEHGVLTEGGVAVLVALRVQYGEGFERSPDRAWALAVLADVGRSEADRVEAVLARMAGRAGGRVVVIAPDE